MKRLNKFEDKVLGHQSEMRKGFKQNKDLNFEIVTSKIVYK